MCRKYMGPRLKIFMKYYWREGKEIGEEKKVKGSREQVDVYTYIGEASLGKSR